MIPGWIAGEYERSDLELDVRLMTERANARLTVGRVERIDSDERVLVLADGTRISYDLASLDVGSVVPGLHPGMDPSDVSARQPARIVEELAATGKGSVVVIGGGAAGVEVAACARAVVEGPVTLVEAGNRLMASHDPSVSRRVQSELEARSVSVRLETKADMGTADLTIRATGASGPALLTESDLPVDDRGFVRVDHHLRVIGDDHLFAAGDCASLENDAPPKAGFHAIEQGKVLAANLTAALESWPDRSNRLRTYHPTSDFLTLLNLGDGTALGTKWGFTFGGRWVRTLKDVIDRRFVRRFQST